MKAFFDDWETVSYGADAPGYASMLNDFDITPDAVREDEILFASYTYENYSGGALVIFQRDGKLFEVHGGHCSCYGLEGQWEPEETTYAALRARYGENGSDTYGLSDMSDEARAALRALLA